MGSNVVPLRQETDPRQPAGERSDEQVIDRFRKWWPGAPVKVKNAIRKIVGDEQAKAHDADARAVLEFLNSKRPGKRGFRPTEQNLRFIRARLDSGATPAELRQVVVVKSRQAGTGEFDPRYLRPATLFNATMFEQYLGELEG